MIDLIFGYVLDNVQSSLNMKFGTNQSIGSAVIGPGLCEILIAFFLLFRRSSLEIQQVLNERA